MKQNFTNTRIDILRRYINGEKYVDIAPSLGLRPNHARNMSQDLQYLLWQYIKGRDIPHPYTINTYPDAWRGHGTREFSPHYLTSWHLRQEKLFWNRVLDTYQAEFGNVDRKLTRDDSITRLNLSYRPMNALIAWKVETIGQVLDMACTPEGLRQVCNMGPATERQVLEVLAANGFDVVIPKTLRLDQTLHQVIHALRSPSLFTDEQREELAQLVDHHLAIIERR